MFICDHFKVHVNFELSFLYLFKLQIKKALRFKPKQDFDLREFEDHFLFIKWIKFKSAKHFELKSNLNDIVILSCHITFAPLSIQFLASIILSLSTFAQYLSIFDLSSMSTSSFPRCVMIQ